jgi:hypothetical protein
LRNHIEETMVYLPMEFILHANKLIN